MKRKIKNGRGKIVEERKHEKSGRREIKGEEREG